MLVVRFAKIVLVAAIAAFAFVVAYDNVVDYNSNYEFVRHVLSMDTTFPHNALMHRAITDPRLWTAGERRQRHHRAHRLRADPACQRHAGRTDFRLHPRT